MYTREQIIEEIKRIAKKKQGQSLKETDFELNSTIPLSTLKFYLGSWARALQEADLGSMTPKKSESNGKAKPKNDEALLLDLIRLNEDSGEMPSAALIEAKGKFDTQHYKARWKSISEAFLLAKKKFPKKPKGIEVQKVVEHIPQKNELKKEKEKEKEKENGKENGKEKIDIAAEKTILEKAADFNNLDVGKPKAKPREKNDNKKKEPVIQRKPPEKNITFIPQTIKPKKIKKKTRISGEPIDFRGLRFAPANKQGVIYLFGMIGYELGFLIESIAAGYPDCEGKRCIGVKQNRWEQVKIHFEYKSSHFKVHGHDEEGCDIIVCWRHDWQECPLEVLELRSTITHLDNHNPEYS